MSNDTDAELDEVPTPDIDTNGAGELEQTVDPTGNGVAPSDVPAGSAGGDLMGFITGGGIKQMLLKDQYEDPETGHTYSQADLIADVINVMRMDAKQIAALHGIDIAVNKMTPERAAGLMEGVTTEGGVDIITVFQDIEDKHDHTLRDLFTADQHAQYMEYKKQMLYSVADSAEMGQEE